MHPGTVSRRTKEFTENGPEVFGGEVEVKGYEERISQLERMLRQREAKSARRQ